MLWTLILIKHLHSSVLHVVQPSGNLYWNTNMQSRSHPHLQFFNLDWVCPLDLCGHWWRTKPEDTQAALIKQDDQVNLVTRSRLMCKEKDGRMTAFSVCILTRTHLKTLLHLKQESSSYFSVEKYDACIMEEDGHAAVCSFLKSHSQQATLALSLV